MGDGGARGTTLDDIGSPLRPQPRDNGDGDQGPPQSVNLQEGTGMVMGRQRREGAKKEKPPAELCPLRSEKCPFAPAGFPTAAKMK